MKKTIILLGLVAILSSCNTGRVAELEAENIELKATVERLTEEIAVSRAIAQNAQIVAMAAQRAAQEQLMKAQEASAEAERK